MTRRAAGGGVRRPLVAVGLASVCMALAGCLTPAQETEPAPEVLSLEQAIAAPYREANRARDPYQHPEQTLEFFGLRDNMTVMEIWPGAGWYSEILAPYLRAHGHYIAAQFPDGPKTPDYQKNILQHYKQALAGAPQLFDRVQLTGIGPPNYWQPAPANSVDMVLTFRNVHNWLSDNTERDMFGAFFRVLKPGGVLGVVEPRAWDDASRDEMIRTGYITQEHVIQMATEAGFTWVAWEEINANPKDKKVYPAGVWTLPPSLRLGDRDREKYLAIGEADRMTLKFVKAP